MTGLVIKTTGADYLIRNEQGDFSCKIKGNFRIKGIKATNPITVGDRVQVGSKSGIDKNVPDGEIRFGFPALPGIQYHRSFAVFRTLPEMAHKMRELEKRLVKVEEK